MKQGDPAQSEWAGRSQEGREEVLFPAVLGVVGAGKSLLQDLQQQTCVAGGGVGWREDLISSVLLL